MNICPTCKKPTPDTACSCTPPPPSMEGRCIQAGYDTENKMSRIIIEVRINDLQQFPKNLLYQKVKVTLA